MECISCGKKVPIKSGDLSMGYCASCRKEKPQNYFDDKKEEPLNNLEVANTFKFRTIIFILLGLITPLWPISLPLFWFLAYKSYTHGTIHDPNLDSGLAPISKFDELKKLKELYDSGVLTESEYDLEKEKLLMKAG